MDYPQDIEQFIADSKSVIKSYITDLDYDLAMIDRGETCLIFTHECGSHAINLYDYADYPAEGVSVPYLFGHANRWHILKECSSILECESVKNAPLIHYYDSSVGRIKKVSFSQACELVTRYQMRMNNLFINDRKAA